jgi:hypothetical protein
VTKTAIAVISLSALPHLPGYEAPTKHCFNRNFQNEKWRAAFAAPRLHRQADENLSSFFAASTKLSCRRSRSLVKLTGKKR